jgi:hypothetical protein
MTIEFSPIEFNPTDRRLLNQRRLKRLRKLFLNPLGLCHLEYRRDSLAVHCPEPWIVDILMEDWDYFIEMTRIIVGVQLISLHYAGEELCQTTTQPRFPVAS